MKAKLVKGTDLTDAQKAQVKNAFGYRWTVENLPRAKQWHGNVAPIIEPINDEQWLKDHAFYIRQDGQLATIPRHCEPVYMANW